MVRAYIILSCTLALQCEAFVPNVRVRRLTNSVRWSTESANDVEAEETVAKSPLRSVDPAVSKKFKVLTCSSTSCAAARKRLRQDEFATFGAFWGRIKDSETEVRVEESPCLGSCKQAPCVGIEHDDFEGMVSLEGMTPTEFSDRVFQKVITEDDADRVWATIENAILVMAEQESEEQEESEGGDV